VSVATGIVSVGATIAVVSPAGVSVLEAPPQAVKKAKDTTTKANFNVDFMILERLNVNEKLNSLLKIGF